MRRLVAGAALLLCAGPAFAFEPGHGGPYAAVQAGAAFWDGDEIPDFFEVDTGVVVLGAAGYAFKSGIRIEGELSWQHLETGPVIAGETDQYSLIANVLYELALGPVRPYAGGGAGLAVVDSEYVGLPTSEFTETEFAWQLIGGLAVPVATSFDLVADYRYTAMEWPGNRQVVHHVTGGVRVRF